MQDNQETMSKKILEEIFITIQQRFDQVDRRLDEQDNKLSLILNIVQVYDQERREIKASLWKHDRRIVKLERGLVKS